MQSTEQPHEREFFAPFNSIKAFYKIQCQHELCFTRSTHGQCPPSRMNPYIRSLLVVNFFFVDLSSWHFMLHTAQEILANTDGIADYLFVAGHHPMYSIGDHGSDKYLIEIFKPLFEEYNVTAYLSGHDHNLQIINDFCKFLGQWVLTMLSPMGIRPQCEFFCGYSDEKTYHLSKQHLIIRNSSAKVHQVISGVGSRSSWNTPKSNTVPPGSSLFFYPPPNYKVGGFVMAKIDRFRAEFIYYNDAEEIVYKFSAEPRLMERFSFPADDIEYDVTNCKTNKEDQVGSRPVIRIAESCNMENNSRKQQCLKFSKKESQ
uniref:Calcineurin-like phosphoesterase domain-containing protein n=1 Tax=Romanomermis culicivorax TaxID=13658 RepID=A0A915KPG6_ROMCU